MNFIDIDEIDKENLWKIINFSQQIKSGSLKTNNLFGKNIALIFEKESTRTRVSFMVGINQLGGNAIVLNKNDIQLSRGENPIDTAKVLERYVDGIVIRADKHETVMDFAKNTKIPIINALTDRSHPCQIMASILTITEKFGDIRGKKIAWFGDVNNVLVSYIHAAEKFEYELYIASPFNIEWVRGNKNVFITSNPHEAAKNADVIVTDTWFSMGDKSDEVVKQKKIEILMKYQVNSEIFTLANRNCIFTHCLPAYRGYEVTSEIIDGKQSVIFDEAENRLHIQKGILTWLFS